MNPFLKGMSILVVASFAGEVMEFFINMTLAKELGEGGLGQYMTVLPTIFLIMMLASFELPVSISKMIAEHEEAYHRSLLIHAIRLSIWVCSILLLVVIVCIPFIPLFNEYHPLLKWIVLFLIPFMTVSSIARGFFMGNQQMGKIAISHFLRRLAQLALLTIIFHLFQFTLDIALLVAICTLAGSEIIVFLYLLSTFLLSYQNLKKLPSVSLKGREVRKNLVAVSIPTTGLRIFHALSHAIQPFLIKAALVHAGVSPEMATEQFGMLAGIAMSIGFFPAFIAHSFLVILIPTVSKAYAERDFSKLHSLLKQVVRLTFLYGIPSVLIFYFFAETLTVRFFHSFAASVYLQLLVPYFLVHFFVIPMQAYLIGLGLVKDAFIHTTVATFLTFLLIFMLGSRPEWQMDGVIVGMNSGSLLLLFLHYVTICKKIEMNWLTKKPTWMIR